MFTPFALINLSLVIRHAWINNTEFLRSFVPWARKLKIVYRLFHNCIPKENRFTLVSKHLFSYERLRNTKCKNGVKCTSTRMMGAWKGRRNNTLISYDGIHIYIFHPYQPICRWVNDIRRILAFQRLPEITLRHLQKSAATGLLLKKSFSI